MGSRTEILARIKANKPEPIAFPKINNTVFDEEIDLLAEFKKKVEVVGGTVTRVASHNDVLSSVSKLFPDSKQNFSTLENSVDFNTISLADMKRPHELEDLDVLVLKSNLGVAENGAVWLEDSQIPMRVLPFITKHLILVLKESDLVPFLHDAYKRMSTVSNDYGVFVSGPSKTADIEQSLVIGAHGALSLVVYLVK